LEAKAKNNGDVAYEVESDCLKVSYLYYVSFLFFRELMDLREPNSCSREL
jgi:hypothetical protein